MIALWLLAGSLLVSVPFALFYDPFDLWPSVYAGGIGGAVYVIALVAYFLRRSKSSKQKIAVAALAAFFLAASYLQWTTMDRMSAYQRATLGKIRTYIANGIFLSEDVCSRAVPAIADFHRQNKPQRSLAEIFRKRNEGKMTDSVIVPVDDISEPQPSKRYVFFSGDTSVTLISVDTIARGKDLAFRNFNGSVGRFQTTTVLTGKEIRYERNN